MARLNWIRIALHCLFWLVYLPVNSVLACILQRAPINTFFKTSLISEAFSLPVKLAFTYFIFYYVIPIYLERSKLKHLIGLALLAFAISTLLYRMEVAWIFFPLFFPGQPIEIFSFQGVVLTVFDLFITLAAAGTIKMVRMHYKSVELEQQLVSEKLQSELKFLRAQTNPHFLFNTLNNLYVLARKKEEKTADAIMMLSKIMRFVLYECRAQRIPVSHEAKVIRDYIELEKLRYNQRLTVRYNETVDNPEAQLAPLLLLPFVENSFKHGASSTTGKVEINIDLKLHQNVLSFSVENTVEEDATPDSIGASNGSNGIGLKNVQRQLDLLYPEQHELTFGRENGVFRASLQVELEER
jgi:two-component system, LytTR family, sensor kinase